jgi:hypothetical protein
LGRWLSGSTGLPKRRYFQLGSGSSLHYVPNALPQGWIVHLLARQLSVLPTLVRIVHLAVPRLRATSALVARLRFTALAS